MTPPPLTTAAPVNESVGKPLWSRHLAVLLAVLLLIGVAHGETVADMTRVWAVSATYSYAWAVVPAAVFLAWWRRRDLLGCPPRPSWWGVGLGGLAGLLWLAGELAQIGIVRHASLVLGLTAVALASLGPGCARRLGPALILLVFLVPAGDVLLLPLRDITARFVELYAWTAGVPVTREGFTLNVDTYRYVVVDDCAGLPFVLMGAFVGSVFGALNARSMRKLLAFGLIGALLGVLGNGARVIAIVASDQLNGTQMALSGHRIYDTLALAILFGGLLVAHTRMRSEPPLATRAPAANGLGGGWSRTLIVPAMAGLALAVGPWLIPEAPQRENTPTPPFPARIAGWQGSDITADWAPDAPLAAHSRLRSYRDTDGRIASLFVARALAPGEKVSAGSLNLHATTDDAAWMPAVTRRMTLCDGTGCVPAMYERLLESGGKRARHIVWHYRMPDTVSVSALRVRLGRAWARLTGSTVSVSLAAVMHETATPDGQALDDTAVLQLMRSTPR